MEEKYKNAISKLSEGIGLWAILFTAFFNQKRTVVLKSRHRKIPPTTTE